MQLIKKLDSIETVSKSGNKRKRLLGLFLCPKCNNQVEKDLYNGKRVDTCGSKECQKNRSFRHGYVGTSLYNIWNNIKIRCDKPKNNAYKYYGGKGISYPDKWKTFKGFFEDMGFSYKEGLTIDRINKDKSYSKENCQWISFEDNRIKDKYKLIGKFDLEGNFIIAYKSVKEAAEKEGIKYPASIAKVARGERKQYKGFSWKYLNN